MRVLCGGRRIERCRDWIDLCKVAVRPEPEAGGRVHPGVGHDHEDRTGRSAERDRYRSQPMFDRTEPVPAIEVQPQEYRFDEERKSFSGERKAEDPTRKRHEAWPQKAELEGQNGTRDSTDGEQ